jgi:hypothetical protein
MSSRLASRCAVVLAIAAVSAPAAQARRAAQEPGVPLSPAQIDAITRHHHEPGTPGPTPAQLAQTPTRVVTVTRAEAFDWGDAGIGAAGGIGALLLASGSALLLRRTNLRRGTLKQA